MNAEETDKIFQKYVAAATLHGEATKTGDYKAANKQYARLREIYRNFEKDPDLGESTLVKLFRHPNVSVRTWASAHALGLGIHEDEAARILEQVSSDTSVGILRLNAEMTLKEWRKKGGLKF